MSLVAVEKNYLDATANAIRNKTGSNKTYKLSQFAGAINNISGGGGSSGWTDISDEITFNANIEESYNIYAVTNDYIVFILLDLPEGSSDDQYGNIIVPQAFVPSIYPVFTVSVCQDIGDGDIWYQNNSVQPNQYLISYNEWSIQTGIITSDPIRVSFIYSI